RYELKYLVPEDTVPAIREELNQHMVRDPYAGPTGYGVWSVYYDTANLRFYREKIEGLKFRRKLRIRRYGKPVVPKSPSPPMPWSRLKSRSVSLASPKRAGSCCPITWRWICATVTSALNTPARISASSMKSWI